MMKKILFAITMMIFSAHGEVWNYRSDSYSVCKYNEDEKTYTSNCTEKNYTQNLSIEITTGKISVNGYLFTIDSTSTSKNSDNEPVLFIYGKDSKTLKDCIVVINEKYVNICLVGNGLVGYSISTNDTNYIQGSGFAVNRNVLITNFHVIKNMEKIVIKIGNKYSFAKILTSDKSLDLAALSVDSAMNACKIDETIQDVGNEVIAYGYPQIQLQGKAIKATKGIISSKFGFQDDVKTYQIDAAIQQGNSGGPLSSKNLIVGVIVSKLNESQNVNYAIKSIFLSAFLKASGIKNIGTKNPIDCTYLIIGSDK